MNRENPALCTDGFANFFFHSRATLNSIVAEPTISEKVVGTHACFH